jgi:hypothetical protein
MGIPWIKTFSLLLAPTADHVLLTLSRVLLSKSLCIGILQGSTEPKFLQYFLKRDPLLPAIQISEYPIHDGIA